MRSALAYLSIVGAACFLLVVGALLFLAPEIDPMRSGISFYALTKYGRVIDLALALVGAAGIALAAALWPIASSIAARIGLALLALWGISSILAGAFPLDAPGTDPTVSGSIHELAGLNFLLIAAAVLFLGVSRSAPAPRAPSPPTASRLAWLVVVSATLLFVFNGPLVALGVGGLVQRLYWLAVVVWLLVMALHLLRSSSPAAATGQAAA